MKRNTSLLLLFVFFFLFLVYSVEGIAGTLQDVKRRGKLIAGVKTEYPPLGFLDNKGGLIKDSILTLPRPLQRNSLGTSRQLNSYLSLQKTRLFS
jgi:ABC-type amino acid transport substrate-binding protein